ncbi:hypothetical protein CASFOL_007929 [Castilleja foliolosa]|uniref:Cytochrome c assembly protein domain-containing protein n=1 Tax=Castilleja foliolosa TaxID=1961234 RepID=A0ABD3E5Y9_9LAMI
MSRILNLFSFVFLIEEIIGKESISNIYAMVPYFDRVQISKLLGYAALLCGSLLSVSLLVIAVKKKRKFFSTSNHFLNESFFFGEIEYMNERSNFFQKTSFFSPRNYYRSQLIQQLDYWSYRVISLGFIFLTIGILSVRFR